MATSPAAGPSPVDGPARLLGLERAVAALECDLAVRWPPIRPEGVMASGRAAGVAAVAALAGVDAPGYLRVTEAMKAPALHGGHQQALCVVVQISDLVEKERVPVGLLDQALSIRDRAGEGATFVAEQLGPGELRVGAKLATNDDGPWLVAQPLVGAPRAQQVGEGGLAGAALPEDQHGCTQRGEALDSCQRRAKSRAAHAAGIPDLTVPAPGLRPPSLALPRSIH